MKKFKKIIVPLLVLLCIPLFLAGCGSKEAFADSAQNKNGEIWFALNGNTVENIFCVQKNSITSYEIGNHKLSFFTGKSNSEVLSEVKKIGSDKVGSSEAEPYTVKLITDDNSKVLKEKVYVGGTSEDDELFTLENPNAKVKVNGKFYYGYNAHADGDKGKLISNSGKQVTFDNDKTNNVEQVNQEND